MCRSVLTPLRSDMATEPIVEMTPLARRTPRPSDPRATVAIVAMFVFSSTAWAQLDVNSLVGHAVDEVGPKLQDVQQAITRYRNNDIDGALQFLERAKAANPQLPPAQAVLARLHIAAGQSAAANVSLERAVRDHPDDPEAYLILAEIALREQHLTAAEQLFQKGLSVNESLPDGQKRKQTGARRAMAGLARIAEQRSDWDSAAKWLERLAQTQPGQAEVWQRLGRARFLTDQVDAAREALAKAKQLNAELEHPQVTIGRLYRQQGKNQEAEAALNAAMQSDADNRATRLAYAQYLLQTDQLEESRKNLDQILEEERNYVSALLWAGVAARMAGEPRTAERHLSRAHLLDPGNVTVTNQLAMALSEQDDPEKLRRAAGFAAAAAQQQPSDGNLRTTLGWLLYQLGNHARAQQELTEALKLQRSLNADSRFLLARILYDRGRNDQAAQILKPAMQMDGIFVKRKDAETLLGSIGN